MLFVIPPSCGDNNLDKQETSEKKEKRYLIDSEFHLIFFDKNVISYDSLPNIFGENAENYFKDFLQHLKDNNFPDKNIRNYFYFQSGRWDLELENNILLKLPKNNIKISLDNSLEFINFNNYTNNKIIDTRVKNQIIVNDRRNKS